MRSTVRDDDKQVPKGFGSEDVTILVLKKHREGRYNRLLEKYFEKYYSGDYVLVTYDELYSGQYADTKKYKYLFGEDTDDIYYPSTYQSRNGYYNEISLFYLKDRNDDRIYKCRKGARYGTSMRNYIKVLERIRKKNKQ